METYLLIMFLFFRGGEINDIRHIATYSTQEICMNELKRAQDTKAPKGTWFACVPSTVKSPERIQK